MKTLGEPQTGSGLGRPSRSSQPRQPGDQLRAGGDDARLVARAASPRGRAGRRGGSSTFQVAEPRPATGSTVAERLGQQHGVADDTRRGSSWSSCRPSPQGASCRSWAVSRIDPPGRAPASRRAPGASTAAAMPPFMSDAPLPVSRSPSTRGGTNGRWTVSRWPLNWSPPGPAAVEPDRDGGRGGYPPRAARPGSRPGQDLRQPVGGRPRLAGRARDLDQPDGRIDEPPPIDERPETIAGGCRGVHGASISAPETPRLTVNRVNPQTPLIFTSISRDSGSGKTWPTL